MMSISIVPVTIDDIELIREWRNSRLINDASITQKTLTAEMQADWFKKVLGDEKFTQWIIKADTHKIGYAAIKGLDESNSRVEFSSLYIGDGAYIGTGVGAEAEFLVLEYIYNELKVEKIFCEVLSDNTKVVNLHKKFGFEVKGVQRKHYIKNTQPLDIILLALFRDIWSVKRERFMKLFGSNKK